MKRREKKREENNTKMRNNWHSFSFRPPAIAPQLQVRVTSSCARLMRGTTRHCGDAPTPTTSWRQRRPSWRHSRFLLFPPHCCCHWSSEIYFQKASRKLRTSIAAARFLLFNSSSFFRIWNMLLLKEIFWKRFFMLFCAARNLLFCLSRDRAQKNVRPADNNVLFMSWNRGKKLY